MAVDVARLRRFIQDYTMTNFPLMALQLQDPDLEECLVLALDEFNSTPPVSRAIKFTIDTFPSDKLILLGAAVEALNMAALKELRGEMRYSDGGVDSVVYYKSPQFNQLKNELMSKWDNDKMRVKKQLNLEACYGGIW